MFETVLRVMQSAKSTAILLTTLLAITPIRAQAPRDDRIQDLEKQIIELRRQIDGITKHLKFMPGVEVKDDDYAVARARFQTKLVRKGPSPDQNGMPKAPAGAIEVEYTSGDLRLKAWVSPPTGDTKKHPAVIFLHGGFSLDPLDWEEAQPYRDAGIIVMTPALRGENGQPGFFSYFYDEVNDVLAAADFLARQPNVDADHMFIAGHSVGGTMTLLAAMASSRFKAAASFSGAPYWSPFTDGHNLPFDRTDLREIQLRSPIVYAGSFKCPVRMYYGTEEADFAEMMTQRTAALAKTRGLNVEALEIQGGHDSHVSFSIPRSILFFRRFLPAESAQKTEPKPLPMTLDIDLGGGTKLSVRRIEPGKFLMGSSLNEAGRREDEQQHEVGITKPFAIGIYAVTQAQYRRVMGQNPAFLSDKGEGWRKVLGANTDDFPIENVNLEEAMEFCQMLSQLPAIRDNGWVVDLPTEEEWEYAARAGTTTAFAFGDSLSSEQANFDGNLPYGNAAKGPSIGRATKVGSYRPNAWGLYDMHGNVLEWTKTVYSPSYQSKDAMDPSRIVTRGGLWLLGGKDLRSARRLPQDANVRGGALGFRLVIRVRDK